MNKKTGTVRDVIYDYIYFTIPSIKGEITERDLINSEWVQRLRQIFQLQSAWLVYPNAVHSRFQHSMGTMQLAGDLAYRLYPMFKQAFPDAEIPEERNYVEEVFRLAGLLHDIGHGPFGHLLDEVYTFPKYGRTHEDISSYIIKNLLQDYISNINRSPGGSFKKKISPEQVAKFIKTPSDFKDYSLWEQVFAKIMMGIYSADAMDFLLRDQYFCGTKEFGKINYRNLIDNTIITKNGLTMRINALPAFRTYLQTRFNMFRHIYLYEKNELYDLAFGKLIPEVLKQLKLGDPFKNITRFKWLTDFGIHHTVPGWSSQNGEKGRVGREWRKMLLRREMPYVKILEKENFYRTAGEINSMVPKDILKQGINKRFKKFPGIKIIISRSDIRLNRQFMDFKTIDELRSIDNIKAISIMDPSTEEFCVNEGNGYIKDIPLKYEVIRVYAGSEQAEEIKKEKKELRQAELFSENVGIVDESEARTDITSM